MAIPPANEPVFLACAEDSQCPTSLCRNGRCWACAINSQCVSGICRGGNCLASPSVDQGLPPNNQIQTQKTPPSTAQTGPGLVIFLATGAALGVGIVRRRLLQS